MYVYTTYTVYIYIHTGELWAHCMHKYMCIHDQLNNILNGKWNQKCYISHCQYSASVIRSAYIHKICTHQPISNRHNLNRESGKKGHWIWCPSRQRDNRVNNLYLFVFAYTFDCLCLYGPVLCYKWKRDNYSKSQVTEYI